MELKPKILIVEDDESQRFLFSEELRDEGYDPIPVKDRREAIREFNNFKPDLVVLDIVMPCMNGIEVLAQVIRQHGDIPIILHSAYPYSKEDFMSCAVDAYIIKSSDLTEFKKAIRNLLEKNKGGGMQKPVVDWDTCIGCGSCVEVCPEVFELKDDKAWVIGPDKCDTCNCQEAVDVCPVQAISLNEE